MPTDPTTALHNIAPIAAQLNPASDAMNAALQQVEATLNSYKIGVEVFLDHELASGIRARREEEDGDGEVTARYRTLESTELGYGRVAGDLWALLVRTMTIEQVLDGVQWKTLYGAEWEEQGRDVLLRAPRKIRIAAIDLLPTLIATIHKEAEKMLASVTKAKEIAASLE